MATVRTVKDLATGLPRQPYYGIHGSLADSKSRSVRRSSIWQLGNSDGMRLFNIIDTHYQNGTSEAQGSVRVLKIVLPKL